MALRKSNREAGHDAQNHWCAVRARAACDLPQVGDSGQSDRSDCNPDGRVSAYQRAESHSAGRNAAVLGYCKVERRDHSRRHLGSDVEDVARRVGAAAERLWAIARERGALPEEAPAPR